MKRRKLLDQAGTAVSPRKPLEDKSASPGRKGVELTIVYVALPISYLTGTFICRYCFRSSPSKLIKRFRWIALINNTEIALTSTLPKPELRRDCTYKVLDAGPSKPIHGIQRFLDPTKFGSYDVTRAIIEQIPRSDCLSAASWSQRFFTPANFTNLLPKPLAVLFNRLEVAESKGYWFILT